MEDLGDGCSIDCFIEATSSARLWSLHMQLVWHDGSLAQRAWMEALAKRPSAARVKVTSMADCLADLGTRDHRLVSYLLSCRHAAKDEVFFSCCTESQRRGARLGPPVHHIRPPDPELGAFRAAPGGSHRDAAAGGVSPCSPSGGANPTLWQHLFGPEITSRDHPAPHFEVT